MYTTVASAVLLLRSAAGPPAPDPVLLPASAAEAEESSPAGPKKLPDTRRTFNCGRHGDGSHVLPESLQLLLLLPGLSLRQLLVEPLVFGPVLPEEGGVRGQRFSQQNPVSEQTRRDGTFLSNC